MDEWNGEVEVGYVIVDEWKGEYEIDWDDFVEVDVIGYGNFFFWVEYGGELGYELGYDGGKD